MARAPTAFYGPAQVATGPTTLFTSTVNTLAVLRHIHISNPSGSAVTLTLSIGADAAATRIFGALSIPANSNLDYFCYHILGPAATVFTASAGTTHILVITVSADLVTLG